MDPKPVWASKTVWVNAIALASAVALGFGVDLGLDGETQTALVGGIMAVVNIALRFVTEQPLQK